MREFRVVLADDQVLFRESFALALINMLPNPASIAQFGSWATLKDHTKTHPADLIMVDLFMPDEHDWRDNLSTLINTNNGAVCVVSANDRHDYLEAAFQIGVNGYISKRAHIEELQHTLTHLCAGKTYVPSQLMRRSVQLRNNNNSITITPRQRDILHKIAEGQSNKDIATELGRKESTIKRHVHNIFAKLNAKNRIEAVRIAQQQGLRL